MKYDIIPVPKPRQTRADKWQKRPRVLRYRAFADEIKLRGIQVKPGDSLIFTMPMPKSWSKKKKAEMDSQPHTQTPDLDNLIKSLLDACYANDSHIWKLGETSKIWGYNGALEIAG